MANNRDSKQVEKLYKEFHYLSNRVLSVALALEMYGLQEECTNDDIAELQQEVQKVIEALRECRTTALDILGPLPDHFNYENDAAILSPNQ